MLAPLFASNDDMAVDDQAQAIYTEDGELLWHGEKGLAAAPKTAQDFANICDWCYRKLKMTEDIEYDKLRYQRCTKYPWLETLRRIQEGNHHGSVDTDSVSNGSSDGANHSGSSSCGSKANVDQMHDHSVKILDKMEETSKQLREDSTKAEQYWIEHAVELNAEEAKLSVDDASDDRYPATWLLFITMCRTRLAALECCGPRSIARSACMTSAQMNVPLCAVSSIPILQYNSLQLHAAIDALAHSWNEFELTWSMLDYVEFLAMSTALLIARNHVSSRLNVSHFAAKRPLAAPKVSGTDDVIADATSTETSKETYIVRRQFVAEFEARFEMFYTSFATIKMFQRQTVNLRDRSAPDETRNRLLNVLIQIEQLRRWEQYSLESKSSFDVMVDQNFNDGTGYGDGDIVRTRRPNPATSLEDAERELYYQSNRDDIERESLRISERIYAARDAVPELIDYLSWWTSTSSGRFVVAQQYFSLIMRDSLSPGDRAIYAVRRPSERPDARTILTGLQGRKMNTEVNNMAIKPPYIVLRAASSRLPGARERIKVMLMDAEREAAHKLRQNADEDETGQDACCGDKIEKPKTNASKTTPKPPSTAASAAQTAKQTLDDTATRPRGIIDQPGCGKASQVLLDEAMQMEHVRHEAKRHRKLRAIPPAQQPPPARTTTPAAPAPAAAATTEQTAETSETAAEAADIGEQMKPRSILTTAEEMAALAALHAILKSHGKNFDFGSSYVIILERFYFMMREGAFDSSYPLIVMCGNCYDVVYRKWRFHTSCIVESFIVWFLLLPSNMLVPLSPRLSDVAEALSGTVEPCNLTTIYKIVNACVDTALKKGSVRQWLSYARATFSIDGDGSVAQLVRVALEDSCLPDEAGLEMFTGTEEQVADSAADEEYLHGGVASAASSGTMYVEFINP